MTMKGRVKWFDEKRGYGFIRCDELRRDIFVHYSQIEGEGYRKLDPEQYVEFEVGRTGKGDQAEVVRVLR